MSVLSSRGPESLVKLASHRHLAGLALAVVLMTLFGIACEKTLASMVSDVSLGVVQIVTPFRIGSGCRCTTPAPFVTSSQIL